MESDKKTYKQQKDDRHSSSVTKEEERGQKSCLFELMTGYNNMFNNALRVTISVIRTLDSRLLLVVFNLMTSFFSATAIYPLLNPDVGTGRSNTCFFFSGIR